MILAKNILRSLACTENYKIFIIFSFNHINLYINFYSQHKNINIKQLKIVITNGEMSIVLWPLI
jgi:hypothetical protein